jgi:hypothetical protein
MKLFIATFASLLLLFNFKIMAQEESEYESQDYTEVDNYSLGDEINDEMEAANHEFEPLSYREQATEEESDSPRMSSPGPKLVDKTGSSRSNAIRKQSALAAAKHQGNLWKSHLRQGERKQKLADRRPASVPVKKPAKKVARAKSKKHRETKKRQDT